MELDKYELEADLVEAILRSPAGFDVGLAGVLCVRKYEHECWAVEWEEYNNPHSEIKREWQVLEFENPRKAAECFIDLRREIGLGQDNDGTYGDYMLGRRRKPFVDKWVAQGGTHTSLKSNR